MFTILKKIFQFIPSIFKYHHEVQRLSKVDYFDHDELLKGEYVTPMFFNAVSLYGNYKAITNLTHHKFNFLLDYLEHGVCFYDTPESTRLMGYADRIGIKNIYTYSNHRKKFIEKYLQSNKLHKNVIAVGPYIKGASNFHTKENLEKIKLQYGKILLVYPCHSIDNVIAQYDISLLINEIDKRASDFDNVFVCLYWKDLMDKDKTQQYINKGYTIVCNGLGSDPHFLSRQKDLLMLADMVITNGLGTHIGYAVCLQKPVYFFKQSKHHTNAQGQLLNSNKNIEETEKLFIEAFQDYSFSITPKQIELVEKYWGTWMK